MGYPEILAMINDYKTMGSVYGFSGVAAYGYIAGCIDALDAHGLLYVYSVSDLYYQLKVAREAARFV